MDRIGWVELMVEPVDEVAIRMTAGVIDDLAADVLCVVEAEDRPSLVRFNEELLGGRYGRAMLIEGNDPRGIDVGLFCSGEIDIAAMRSNVDLPDPAPDAPPGKKLFSRDCVVHRLDLPGVEDVNCPGSAGGCGAAPRCTSGCRSSVSASGRRTSGRPRPGSR